MRKKLCVGIVMMVISLSVPSASEAQIPIADIIKQAVTQVIKAVDLQIQRIQNKTIWLQNVQKALENQMSKLKLAEISDWVEKQRTLYADYFDELWKVKSAIAYYHRVKEIIEREVLLVNEYRSAYALFKQDKHFTLEELKYMEKVYEGILNESVENLDQVYLVINAFATQMGDAKRLEIINSAADRLQQNLADLREFNNGNKMLSLQRAADQKDIEVVRKLYGL